MVYDNMNKEKIQAWMDGHAEQLFRFLRQLIALPSISCHEVAVVNRVKEEMEALSFDEIIVDGMGNILGRVGNGKHCMAFDGHLDTVDVGNLENWAFHPYIGNEDDVYVYGRGASDQTGGFCSALYGAAMARDLGLLGDYTVWVVGTVQEEDCDGLCWQYILDNKVLDPKPEFVVLTEPTALRVYRGHRGRMEIEVSVKGLSAHGSAPDRGINAIYRMARVVNELESLNQRLSVDAFLGKGSLTVSQIFFTSPSRCAVADSCRVSIDRRLTLGETASKALEEIRSLPSVIESSAKVEMYRYTTTSYNGADFDVPCYFPTWLIPPDHKLCGMMMDAHESLHGDRPILDKWTFSTNGVAIMGMNGIPCIGYGPGREEEAHAPDEKVLKSELLRAAMTYAASLSHL